MAKAAPPSGPAAAPARAPAGAAPSAGGTWRFLALAGWIAAAVAGVVAYGQYKLFASQKQSALDQQAAGYEQKLQQVKADLDAAKAAAVAQVKKAQDDAAANQASIQAELDFQKLPELPLETLFRAGPVLYIESRTSDDFKCTVRLTRAAATQTKELEFEIKSHTFRDLGAIGDWVFARGDKVEFVKSGFKPRQLVAP